MHFLPQGSRVRNAISEVQPSTIDWQRGSVSHLQCQPIEVWVYLSSSPPSLFEEDDEDGGGDER
ncbi:hypothetical protein IQ235_17085 [Oscillatoriales cyanobacterium LEGE 11467]|uniref:Uncharacterized protein n=1 Tax=Zarconia navalis LEGE 11467 TaxID=1828826 RepID=A0A928ZA99_9CYAN|nr:hypothetical protein [Zarconia navalis]MBE9042488.1 hypothetical protein [Zarconia navalis LEGE 11467]